MGIFSGGFSRISFWKFAHGYPPALWQDMVLHSCIKQSIYNLHYQNHLAVKLTGEHDTFKMKFIKAYNRIGFHDNFILWFTLSCDILCGFLLHHYVTSDLRYWGEVLYWYTVRCTKYQSRNIETEEKWNRRKASGCFSSKIKQKKLILNWLFQDMASWQVLIHEFFSVRLKPLSLGSIFCVHVSNAKYKLWCMPPVFTCSKVLKTSIVVLHFAKQMQQKTRQPPAQTLRKKSSCIPKNRRK